MRVYLVGPITGQSDDRISGWRDHLRTIFPKVDYIDPASAPFDSALPDGMRETASETLRRLQHGRFVLDRNKMLIRSADVVLANFTGADSRPSIGSIGELFWADAFAKPIIVIREEKQNVHDHAMINALASRICFSLEEGCLALAHLDCH